jgi:hypothetical protein
MSHSSSPSHSFFILWSYATECGFNLCVEPIHGRDMMDANWLVFGAAILGLVVAAVVVYKKDQKS